MANTLIFVKSSSIIQDISKEGNKKFDIENKKKLNIKIKLKKKLIINMNIKHQKK